MSYILKIIIVANNSLNNINNNFLLESIKDEICTKPIKNTIIKPFIGGNFDVIIKWSKLPICETNLAISDCLYMLPSIYSDTAVLLHTKQFIEEFENKYNIKLAFYLSKELKILNY